MIHRLYLACFFLLPVAAVLGVGRVSTTALLSGLGGVALVVFVLHRRALLKMVPPNRGADVGELEGAEVSPYHVVQRRVSGLKQQVQEASLRLVNTNIQLLSVRELWQALAQPGRLEHIVDGALSYCHRASGFHEVVLLRLEPRSGELVGRWLHPGKNGPVMESVRWSMRGIGGTVARCLRSPRSLLVEEAARQPLLTVNGDIPAVFSSHGSYLVVPLMTPLPRRECIEAGWLYQHDCPAFTPANIAEGRGPTPTRDDGLDLSPCLSCRHYPLYGLMVVTDRARPGGIRKADQLTLESLCYAVSAVLQNAALYGDVKSAERFRDQILDGMTNGLITTDDRGRVVFSNRRAQQLLEMTSDQLAGRSVDQMLDVQGGESPLRATLLTGEASLRNEVYLRPSDGDRASRIPVLLNVASFRPEDGGMRGAILVFEDLSGVKAMQEEIRHLDTLAAIGRFASSMAHEIRNPLGGISAGMDYLSRSSDLKEDDLHSIEIIQNEIERLDRIIRNLFSVARPAKLQLVESQPVGCTERAMRSLQDWARQKGIDLVLRGGDELPPFHVDRDLLHQLLLNLLKNAIEASPENSVVELTVRRIGVDDIATDRTLPEHLEGGVLIEVRDQGPGIEPEALPKLFEPFYSTKSEGTGLGLFVCHSIAQRHGGQIQVRSRPGGGACFRLCLPQVPALIGGKT